MNDKTIAIVTDSGTNVPADFARDHDVRIIPLTINYSDGSFQSEVDITTQEVVERMETEVPTTSLPSPSTIRAVLEGCKADGYERAVVVTISSGLSATNQTAHLVANQMEDFDVTVVDTKSIGVAAGLIVMDAALMAEAGVDVETMERRLNDLADESLVVFTVDDLTYLRQGGRISEATFRLGTMLNINPIFECDEEGRYATVKKCRGRKRAVKGEVELVSHRARNYDRVVMAVCDAAEDAPMDRYVSMLEEATPNCAAVLRSGISPDLIVHTGVTLLGMTVLPLIPEMERWLESRA